MLGTRVVRPLGWVALLEWNELKTDREVDEVKVKIVQFQILESLETSFLYVFLSMIGIP